MKLVLFWIKKRVCYLKKKDEIKRGQNIFNKRSCENLTTKEESYEIVFAFAERKLKTFSVIEETVKLVSKYLQDVLAMKKYSKKSRRNRHVKANSYKTHRRTFLTCIWTTGRCCPCFTYLSYFPLALDESVDLRHLT